MQPLFLLSCHILAPLSGPRAASHSQLWLLWNQHTHTPGPCPAPMRTKRTWLPAVISDQHRGCTQQVLSGIGHKTDTELVLYGLQGLNCLRIVGSLCTTPDQPSQTQADCYSLDSDPSSFSQAPDVSTSSSHPATLIFLLFLERPASGPLHGSFFLPGMRCSNLPLAGSLSFWSQLKGDLLLIPPSSQSLTHFFMVPITNTTISF